MKRLKRCVSISCVAIGVLVSSCASGDLSVESVSLPDMTKANAFYASNRAPLQAQPFIKLPIGAIRPEGWVRECLLRQRDGLSGHLGEISSWLQKEGNAWLNADGKGLFGWEEVPYWLKGYGDMAYILGDTAMIAEAKVWLNGMLSSQREDGYFGPWIEKGGKPDLWGNMIALWCLQSYYEFSGDDRVISFMSKYFKWQLSLPDELFLKDYWENSRGGDNLYSVIWLYNLTGESWLLDLAGKIHRNTANWRQESSLPNWHNVNIAQCFREPATWWLISKDSADLRATYNDFWLIRRTFGQVPGGMFGGDENSRMGYIDPRQGIETCGSVEQMSSDELLLRYTGDPFWADHCEEVAINTYPASMMPDLRSLRYITSPNMVTADSHNHHPGIDNRGPFLIMNPFSSRCCQHNHGQGWPYYAENLWMATSDGGLAAMLYSASSVKAKVGAGNEVEIIEETHYPFDEQVCMTVKTADSATFPLYIRIPAWCDKASIRVNGQIASGNIKTGSYARITRQWNDGDKISIDFPMHLSVRQWAVNQNSVSVNYGPLTFSLKIGEEYVKTDSKATAIGDSHWQDDADASRWPSWEIRPTTAWNYGIECDLQHPERSFTVVKRAWPSDNFPFTADSAPIELTAKGRKIPSWGIDSFGLCAVQPTAPVHSSEPAEDLTLIPMGAARLRITAFPKIEK